MGENILVPSYLNEYLKHERNNIRDLQAQYKHDVAKAIVIEEQRNVLQEVKNRYEAGKLSKADLDKQQTFFAIVIDFLQSGKDVTEQDVPLRTNNDVFELGGSKSKRRTRRRRARKRTRTRK